MDVMYNQHYFAGMWSGDLGHGLLRIQDTSHDELQWQKLHGEHYVAVTWSWTSGRGLVSHCFTTSMQVSRLSDVFLVLNFVKDRYLRQWVTLTQASACSY